MKQERKLEIDSYYNNNDLRLKIVNKCSVPIKIIDYVIPQICDTLYTLFVQKKIATYALIQES